MVKNHMLQLKLIQKIEKHLILLMVIFYSIPFARFAREGGDFRYEVRRSGGFVIRAETRMRARLLMLMEWIKNETSDDAVILFHSPRVVYLVADRKCVTTPITANPEEFWSYVAENGVDYIIVDELYREIPGGINLFTSEYLLPALAAHPERYRMAYEVEGTRSMVVRVRQQVFGP